MPGAPFHPAPLHAARLRDQRLQVAPHDPRHQQDRHAHAQATRACLATAGTAFRRRLFANFDVACAASASFARACNASGATLVAWTLLPDHAHWLFELDGRTRPADVVARLKAMSTRAVSDACGSAGGQVWAPGHHDQLLRPDESLQGAAAWLVSAPVRARLVPDILAHPFWDARWLAPGSDWMP